MSKKVAAIGIDLGTTTSCVAGYVNGELSVIENKDGDRITRSTVWFDKRGGRPVVGSNAVLAASSCPGNYIYEVKRMFGKGYHSKEVQKSIKNWSYKVQEIKTTGNSADENITDNIGIVLQENDKDKVIEPIQVSACVLRYMYDSARQRLGIAPTFVTITVPAYFNEGAKQRTIDAAEIAFSGITDEEGNKIQVNVNLLPEPTAAAIAYGCILMKNKQVADGEEKCYLIFDLGGGTFDVCGIGYTFDSTSPVGIVKAIDGDNYLGGCDFDNRIIEMAKKKFAELNNGQDPDEGISHEEKLKNDLRLRQEAIKVKNSLSSNTTATFNLPCYRGSTDLVFDITRVQFERACKPLFEKLREKCSGVLLSLEGITPIYYDDGRLNEEETLRNNPSARSRGLANIINEAKKSIDKVIMVGGSSRIPKVKAILEEFFGETANTPSSTKKVTSPLNPDEAVAFGAAYFASASRGVDDEEGARILLIDQVPLNLNIETYGGVATKLIEARTAIPCKQSQIFSTAADNQTSVEIVITQGNRPISADNYHIGRFTLSGINPAPRGVPQIEVTFEVDQNNILKVTAMDKGSGKKEIYVENMSNKLSDADIEKMKKMAEENATKDALFAERTNLKNQFENVIYSFEDKLESMSADDAKKNEIKSKLSAEESWLKGLDSEVDPAVIRERMNAFTAEMAKILENPSSTSATNNPDVEEVN